MTTIEVREGTATVRLDSWEASWVRPPGGGGPPVYRAEDLMAAVLRCLAAAGDDRSRTLAEGIRGLL